MPPVTDPIALEHFIDEYLFDLGYELVDFTCEPMGHALLLTCYIDRPLGGVSIKDCQLVNDKLRLVMEADRLAGLDFRLIISSPGLDRVIKKPADFVRFMGRRIKVWFPPSESARKGRTLEGILESYQDGEIMLVLESGEALEFHQQETKLVRLVPQIDFSARKGGQEPSSSGADPVLE